MDLSNFQINSKKEEDGTLVKVDMRQMFCSTSNLATIYVGEGWKLHQNVDGNQMFWSTSAPVGGRGTKFTGGVNHTWELAQIDAIGHPGVLTLKVKDIENPIRPYPDVNPVEEGYTVGETKVYAAGESLPDAAALRVLDTDATAWLLDDGIANAIVQNTGTELEDGLAKLAMEDVLPRKITPLYVAAVNAVSEDVSVTVNLGGVYNALVTANGAFVGDILYTDDSVLAVDIEADEGYLLPEYVTVIIDDANYTINTIDGSATEGIYFDGVTLYIPAERLSNGSVVALTIDCVEAEFAETESVEDESVEESSESETDESESVEDESSESETEESESTEQESVETESSSASETQTESEDGDILE